MLLDKNVELTINSANQMANRLQLNELCPKDIRILKEKKPGILWLKDKMTNFLHVYTVYMKIK